MTIVDLCPACLTELPADYPFDHVAIDQALSTRPRLFTTMDAAERAETLRVGTDRGMGLVDLARQFGADRHDIRALIPLDVVPQAERSAKLEAAVKAGWEKGLSDSAIAMTSGSHVGSIAKVRRRLGLESLYGPGGRPKNRVPA
jgi:hypothetical protein